MHYFPMFFSSSIWRMQNIWAVVALLRRNPHWWSPIISSAYGVNLDSRMLDKILYVVDKCEIPLNIMQSLLSPFLQTRTVIDSFRSSGNSFPSGLSDFFVSSVCLLVLVTMVDKNKAVVCCLLATSAIMLSENTKRKRKMWSKKWYLKRNISCNAYLLN